MSQCGTESATELTAAQRVRHRLNMAAWNGRFPPILFVEPALYGALVKEVSPRYVERYGSLLTNGEVLGIGYENILFQGVAVCPMPEREK